MRHLPPARFEPFAVMRRRRRRVTGGEAFGEEKKR